MQNGTNCNTNGGNTQHNFGELRGIGHDKSVPYAYGINVEKYSNEHHRVGYLLHKCIAANTPKGVGADLSCPHHNQNQLVLVCKMV